jgi:hypothetical protein
MGAAARTRDRGLVRAWSLIVIVAAGCEVAAPLIAESDQGLVVAGALHGSPAALGPDRWVVSRAGDEPGEAELYLVDRAGGERVIAPHPGPDESPTVLPDGRVLFVSGRTGVMSVWIWDPATERVVQRTNVGLVPGGSRLGFVPPPLGAVTVAGGRASWDDGYGARWSIALAPALGEASR